MPRAHWEMGRYIYNVRVAFGFHNGDSGIITRRKE